MATSKTKAKKASPTIPMGTVMLTGRMAKKPKGKKRKSIPLVRPFLPPETVGPDSRTLFNPLDVKRFFGDKAVSLEPRKHSHYFRSVKDLQEIDIYRVLELFGVTDQALGHAIKKLIVPGMRGGGKTTNKDVQEAIDTLQRWQEMRREDENKSVGFGDAQD